MKYQVFLNDNPGTNPRGDVRFPTDERIANHDAMDLILALLGHSVSATMHIMRSSPEVGQTSFLIWHHDGADLVDIKAVSE